MKVLYHTYPEAFYLPGGAERHLSSIIEKISDFDALPIRYDMWRPQLEDAQLVHHFSVREDSGLFFKFVKSQNIPLIVSPNIWLEDLGRGEYIEMLSNNLRLADLVIFNSHEEARRMGKVLNIPKCRTKVVHLGVDKAFSNPVEKGLSSKILGIEEPFFLSVSSIHPKKNIIQLIKAIQNFKHYKLLIFGEIRDASYAEECFSLGGDQLVYAGKIPYRSSLMASAYRDCELFISTSNYESPSLSSLEAATSGAKVLITKQGSSQEYLGGFASYFSPSDLNEIVECIGRTIKEKWDGQSQANHMKKNFSMEENCYKLSEIYKNLAYRKYM